MRSQSYKIPFVILFLERNRSDVSWQEQNCEAKLMALGLEIIHFLWEKKCQFELSDWLYDSTI